MMQRLIGQWVYGGALAGLMLLCLAPLLAGAWPATLAVTFLQLPVYMLHQYEEHDNDRFRLFFNRLLGDGREVLTPAAVFVINVPGVWGVIVITLYLAAFFNAGFGLIAVYLTLVNAVAHIGAAVALRRYNPGLATGGFAVPAVIRLQPLGVSGGACGRFLSGNRACGGDRYSRGHHCLCADAGPEGAILRRG